MAMRRSRAELEEEFFVAAQTLKLSYINRISLAPAPSVEPYPPCMKPLSELVPMFLSDLELDKHHRGHVLVVRTFCEPNLWKMTSSLMSAIEDGNGDVDRIDLRTFPLTKSPEIILPKDAVMAIKEPYYKSSADGGVLVRVDHPSDLVLLKPGDMPVPDSLISASFLRHNLTAAQLKDNGNTAFQKRNWEEAAECYSAALADNNSVAKPPETSMNNTDRKDTDKSSNTNHETVLTYEGSLRHTLHRNRAQARLNLGQYELALDDALAAVIPGDDLSREAAALNSKAFFRAGLANYEMENFSIALGLFKQAQSLNVGDKSNLVQRTEKRLQEQGHGEFDFAAMKRSVTTTQPRLDHASFLSNTCITSAGDHGRGIFATKDLEPGEVVFVEKAFYAAFGEKLHKSGRITYNDELGRFNGVMEKIRRNPLQAARYLDLYDGGTFEDQCANMVDGVVPVNVFQVQAIANLCGFGCDSATPDNKNSGGLEAHDGKGIWLHAAYANHSCIPNSSRAFIGDMMIVRAVRNIREGEEISIQYWGANESCSEQEKRFEYYNFRCGCPLCEAHSHSVCSYRDQLSKQAEAFISSNQQAGLTSLHFTSAAKLQDAKDLLALLDSTYEESLFERLPRPACVPLAVWICQNETKQDVVLANTQRLLRDQGYFVTFHAGSVSIDRSRALVTPYGVHAAIDAMLLSVAIENYEGYSELKKLAREMYAVYYGEIEGFEEFLVEALDI